MVNVGRDRVLDPGDEARVPLCSMRSPMWRGGGWSGVSAIPAAFVFELDLVAHQQGVTAEASLLPSVC